MNLTSDQEAARVVRALTLQYLETCDVNRVNRGTAAKLLGVSRTRLGQLEKAAKAEETIMVSLGVFLRTKQVLEAVPKARESGALPASASRGKAQNAVLEFFGFNDNDGE